MKTPIFSLSGTRTLLMDFSAGAFDLHTQERLWAFCADNGALRRVHGVLNVLLGVNNVAVIFDPFKVQQQGLQEAIACSWADVKPLSNHESHLVEVPVDYRITADSDLPDIAANAGLDERQLIELHTSADYRVACIGWVPGFAFMMGLPEKLHVPRRSSPRLKVPAGSVGIGGAQTGVIPIPVPSGWNLIGHTDIELFCPTRANPCLLAPGDTVRFVSRRLA